MAEISTKPYLIRAIWQWCVDQGFTPYLSVAVDEHTRVPPGHIKNGEIVLNIGMEASHQLDIGNEFISFQARFNGAAQSLLVPVGRVNAIYARENGQGMGFEVEDTILGEEEATPSVATTPTATLSSVPTGGDSEPDTPTTPPATPSGNRPQLTRIK